MTAKFLSLILALLVGTAGLAVAQQAAPDSTSPDAQVLRKSYHYTSAEGNFQVTWPSGCGELRIRDNEPEYFVGEEDPDVVLVHVVVCDRDKKPGEGCSITATFEARQADGSPAGPEQVMARVRNTLKVYGVKVVRQSPIKREFEDDLVVEGVDVMGTGPNGEGEFWVRGLLSYHDIYVLTAWNAQGKVWDDPAYREFFNGFVPYAE